MQDLINYVTNIPASSWYHLAAFLLTGAGAQYTVQLVKVISKKPWGKTALRFMNGLFTTLYTAAGAIVSGGMSLGNFGKTALALSTVSVLIYRIHDSVLYKSAEKMVDDAVQYNQPAANRFGEPVDLDESKLTFTLAKDKAHSYDTSQPLSTNMRINTDGTLSPRPAQTGTPASSFAADD